MNIKYLQIITVSELSSFQAISSQGFHGEW